MRPIKRTIQKDIIQQMNNFPGRPILITGLVFTGKSTLASEVGRSFSQFITIDLSIISERKLFINGDLPETILKSILFLHNGNYSNRDTLILLKEIHFCPEAITWFFQYTHNPFPFQLIATSSFLSPELETPLKLKTLNLKLFYLHPLSFGEFLQSNEDQNQFSAFSETPVPYYAYEKLLRSFHIYSLIGGMPKIVSGYIQNMDLTKLHVIYEDILWKINELIEYKAESKKSVILYQETLQNAFPFAATRITYHHFGNVSSGSREIARAFRFLERLLVSRLIWPTTETIPGKEPDRLKSPRLQMADTGLVNYFSGIQDPLFRSRDMNAIFEGQIARQVVGQELAFHHHADSLSFWIRNKAQSTAEVDFVVPYNDLLIPVMVKSGEPGRLRGLHQFIDEAPHPFAVRLSASGISVGQYETIMGKKFYLLNLPYFLASKIPEHLKGFIRLVLE